MSDVMEGVPGKIETSPSAGAGESLKQAREAAGLHIAALAVMLKVPVKKLEALEGNRFDLLPDAVFVRALAASVCRTLKVDAAPILALLPMTSSPKLIYQGVGINEEFRAPGYVPSATVFAHLSKSAVLAGLALLLGAVVLVFLPSIKEVVAELRSNILDSSTPGLTSAEGSNPADTVVRSTKASLDTVPDADAMISLRISPNASARPDGVAASRTSEREISPRPAPTSDETIAKSGVLSSALPPATPSALASTLSTNANTTSLPDLVVFTARGESWVEATDANGRVVLRRTLALGDIVGATGSLPLRVIVGKANVTQVQVRGAGFDLSPVSKDNVARFEVK